MKEIEIGPAVLAGEKVMVGEFRDWQCDESESKKVPGTYNVFEKVFVVVGRDSIEVSRFAPKGMRKDGVKRPAWKPGDRLSIRFANLAKSPFGSGLRSDGQCELLTK